MTHTRLIIAMIATLSVSTPAMAKVYKWLDDKGVTHYGETIPAEYASKDRKTLNKAGVVVNTQDVPTPEERHAQQVEAEKTKTEAAVARDKLRYDKSLTDSYSTVEEIELSRTRSLQQIESRIENVRSQLKAANRNLQDLQKDLLARSKKEGKPAISLQDEVKIAEQQVARLQQTLDKQVAEKSAVDAKFDADKTRYKELTGK